MPKLLSYSAHVILLNSKRNDLLKVITPLVIGCPGTKVELACLLLPDSVCIFFFKKEKQLVLKSDF